MNVQAQQHADIIARVGKGQQQQEDSPPQKQEWRKSFLDQHTPKNESIPSFVAQEEVKVSKHAKRRQKKKKQVVVCEGGGDADEGDYQ